MSHTEDIRKTYDVIASEYSKANFDTFWPDEFTTFSKLIPGKSVLDIGCGAGRDAVMFSEAGFAYTGIDISPAMLAIAQERAPMGTYRQMDFFALDFPDASFDGFWAVASFLHVPKSELSQCLTEAKRILTPNGIGFISIKQKEAGGMEEGVVTQQRFGTDIARYFAFYEPEEFAARLVEVGFELVDRTVYHEDDERNTMWLGYFVRKSDT